MQNKFLFRAYSNTFYNFSRKKYIMEPMTVRENLKAYFDISINNAPSGRIIFELFAKDVPRTALNFFHLCKGDVVPKGGNTKLQLSYKGSKFHRVIPGFMCQGGDIVKGDGSGSISIYGETFADENFVFSHDQPGMLSMANRGPNTNGSQFFITTADCAWLDGKHVVFGKVISGIEVVNAIEASGTSKGEPKQTIIIKECGVLEEEKKEHSDKHHDSHHAKH